MDSKENYNMVNANNMNNPYAANNVAASTMPPGMSQNLGNLGYQTNQSSVAAMSH